MKAVSLTPHISADSVDLLDSFNSKVKNVIDDIAPVKSARRQADKNHLGENQQQSKKGQCRKAERMWGKTKLEIHYIIYKDSLHAFNVKLATARQTFLSNFVNINLNNTHNLLLLLRD